MIGWIKLHRSLKSWSWYHDINATRLLIHLLITVNYEKKKWQNIIIKPGSRVISWEILANECGLSVRQTRTAMDKLLESNEVTRIVTNRYQIISLTKWEQLQGFEEEVTGKVTGKGQTDDKQATTTKENKEVKETKNINGFSFKKSLCSLGIRENLVNDFLKNRKLKRLASTETAFKLLKKELEKNNLPINDLMETIVSNGWGGFKNEWLHEKKEILNGKPISLAEKMKLQYGIK